MKYCVFLFFLCIKSTFGLGNESSKVFLYNENTSHEILLLSDSTDSLVSSSDTAIYLPKNRKLKAVILALLLGHFGVHRIYLGTKANVPVVYTLTLGGGFGLLPLMDIIAILTSKDLSEFENNSKVIMWVR